MSFLEKLYSEIQSKLSPSFPLPEIPFDGTRIRFDIKSASDVAGWCYVNPWDYKGNEQFTATFGCFIQGVRFKFTSYDPKSVDKSFLKDEKKQIKETKKK